jgi:putative membrane-bound dehydrogenase-like protein
MKLLRVLALLLSPLVAAQAAGPIRVLYFGKSDSPSSKHCAFLMRELGRDAIWFDYFTDAKAVTQEALAKFDAVMVDGPAADLAGAHAVQPEFGTDEKTWTPQLAQTIREKLLAAVSPERRAEWEKFLAQREPEQREPSPWVANYEKRPQPLTFQKPMSVKASMERTQVPIDLRLELFAAEPDIAKPIAFAWDERGRLWVAETRDYPHGVTPTGEGNDDIKICEDTDGDGKADKFTIFADHLNLPTSITFARGGVIVAQAPRLLFLKDTNGDDKADVREVIMDAWGVRDTHAQINNLHYGYDNWIQGCVGYSGFEGMVGGKMQKFAMGTFRFKPDGSDIEFLHQFSNNSWGQSQNAAGDDFGGTANGAPIFFGGIPAHLWPDGVRGLSAKKINVEPMCHTITPNFRQVDVFGGFTAAAGSAFIYSENLPKRLQGNAMVCEPTMKVITLMDVQSDGAGYLAKDGFNLVSSSDEWMSPVFSEVGPDGAVWFADFQNFIIQHNPTPSVERGGFAAKTGAGGAHENPLRDHERGRIYRVVSASAKKPAISSLKDASTADLVAALSSPTQFWRVTAQRLLVDGKKTDAAGALKKLAAGGNATAAVHALWALQGLGALDDATEKAALGAKDPMVRRTAIRALPNDARGETLLLGSGGLGDADPHVHLAALVKAAELPTTSGVQQVVRGIALNASVQNDEWLREATKLLSKKHHVAPYREGPNLLPNPGFEITGADGLPEGWRLDSVQRPPGSEWTLVTDEKMKHSGERAVRCITRENGNAALIIDVMLKPHTQYRLSGWVKTHALGRGTVSLQADGDQTDRISSENSWKELETTFHTGDKPQRRVALSLSGKGDGYFDDVRLSELLAPEEDKLLAGDVKRGEQVVFKHPTIPCILCHTVKGQGSTVGPPLDGIATRATPAYITESLLEPNKVLAKGFEALGTSPMPPMGLVLKPQEIEDVKAYLQTLK